MKLGAVVILCVAGASVSGVAWSQASGTGAGKPVTISGRAYSMQGYAMYVKGAPFSLTAKRTTTAKQADGAERVQEKEERVFRDGEGRFRLDAGEMKDGKFVVRTITIFDPVALTSVTYMAGNNVGRLSEVLPRSLPTPEEEQKAAEQGARSAAYLREHPGAGGTEDLGTQTLLGEVTHGMRAMQTANGPDGRVAMRMVTETWTSPELGIALLTKTEGGPGGDRTYEVTSLRRGEPDGAVFKLPDGMMLVEEVPRQ